MFLDIQNSPENKVMMHIDARASKKKKQWTRCAHCFLKYLFSEKTSAGQHSDRASTGAAGV